MLKNFKTLVQGVTLKTLVIYRGILTLESVHTAVITAIFL
jgi:hypothetical protein